MINKKYEIVFISKDTNFRYNLKQSLLFSDKYKNVTFKYIENNTHSITKIYNNIIKKHRELKDIDYLILMHADVVLDFEHFLNHIESLNNKYDVMGLCGCSKCSMSNTPLNWFNASKGFEQYRWGSVIHGELNNQHSFWNYHSPTIQEHSVALIDGLCFILSKKVIEETTLLFDEQFSFSGCYDTDFSLECVLKYKLSLGVLTEMSLYHYSIGKSIINNEFAKAELLLRNKWNFDIPDMLKEKLKLCQ